MNPLKKIISLLLTFGAVLTLFSCSLKNAVITPDGVPSPTPSAGHSPEEEPITSNGTYGLTYNEGLDYCVVTGYHGTEADVFIPSEWNGKEVVGINSYAFNENPVIKTITITSSIVSVAKNALVGDYTVFCETDAPGKCELEDCNTLHPSGWHKDWYDKSGNPEFVKWGCGSVGSFSWTSNDKGEIVITGYIGKPVVINIPEMIGSRKVVAIKSDAFNSCESLKVINLPSSIKEMGNFAFRNCSQLEEISIPREVTHISGYIFDGCTSLKTVNISTEATEISAYAFANCTSLEVINIPSSVQTIERNAFLGCPSLTIYVDFEKGQLPSGWLDKWNSDCPVIYKNN